MGVCSNNCSQIKSSKVPNNNIKPKENKNINIAKEQEDINTIVNKENIKAFRFYNKTKDINIPLIVDSDSQIILQIYKHKEYLKKWIALCTKKEEVSDDQIESIFEFKKKIIQRNNVNYLFNKF